MKIKIVYFAYLIPGKWLPIVEEQLDSLKKLELYNEATNIYMSVISDDYELATLKKLLADKYSKVEMKNIFQDNVYEYPGLKTIYQIAEDDDNTLLIYFHSKGMTSNQHETRQYLFKYTFENYKDYINEFEYNKHLEVAGAIPHENGFIFFNFFWARSSYVRNYCENPIVSDNRYIWEVWIGNEFSRKKEIITYSPIIKYDRVKQHHEVWAIHDKMIKNHYCHLLNSVYIDPVNVTIENMDSNSVKEPSIDTPVETNKPVRINTNQINEVSKPVRIDTPVETNKPVRINTNQINEVSKPGRIDTLAENKPVRIDTPVENKPVRINTNQINEVSKPVRIDTQVENKPVRTDRPVENKPVRTDRPVENKPVRTDRPVENKPVRIDTSVETNTFKIDTPAPKLAPSENNKVRFEMGTELYNLTDLNPYRVFERLRSKDDIVIEIGSDVGLNTYILSKRFKKVVAVEHDNESIERLESNIRKFCHKNIQLCKKKLVQVKTDIKNEITFKELLYNYIHKNFQTVSLFVCNIKDDSIIEDLFHYSFHSKTKIFIKFNQDVSKYSYLFDYFNYNSKLLNTNNWMFFEPKNDPHLQMTKANMPIVIIGFNQYTYISKMVKQLEKLTNDIIIIDNKSDYKPLLEYYEKDYKYSLLKMDKNFGHKVYETSFIISLLGNMYIITDPDLKFNDKLPANCIHEMVKVSNDYKAGRVGFALLVNTDDIRPGLSYAGMPLKQWEARFWVNRIQHPTLELYSAPIDTTFCLLNMKHNNNGLSIRVAGDYVCKHLPWHHNYYLELLDDEYDHYLLNNRSTNFWVDNKKDKSVNKTILSGVDIEMELDDWIIDKVKDAKGGAINIGYDSKVLNDKFNFIINNPDKTIVAVKNLSEPNIDYDSIVLNDKFEFIINNLDNTLVAVKNKLSEITWKQFIYDQELKVPITFINIFYDGKEETIIEDLLHYSWINKSNICIHFNVNNWITKTVSLQSFKYIFNFFKIYSNNILIDNPIDYIKENKNIKILFCPNKNLSKDLFKQNMTCVIIGYNQPTYIKKMVNQLEPYTNDIVIIDNNSNFEPLLQYYEKEYKYTLLRMKSNLGHKVYEKIFMDKIIGDIFILTDPDLQFNNNLPTNFIEDMINISNYYQAEKVGFALLYDAPDIRTDVMAFGKSIKEWEKRYWTFKYYYPGFENDIWSAAIDTTFCLVNKQNKGGHYRISGNYLCKHLPWHVGFEKEIPTDEFENYTKNNVSTNYWRKNL